MFLVIPERLRSSILAFLTVWWLKCKLSDTWVIPLHDWLFKEHYCKDTLVYQSLYHLFINSPSPSKMFWPHNQYKNYGIWSNVLKITERHCFNIHCISHMSRKTVVNCRMEKSAYLEWNDLFCTVGVITKLKMASSPTWLR